MYSQYNFCAETKRCVTDMKGSGGKIETTAKTNSPRVKTLRKRLKRQNDFAHEKRYHSSLTLTLVNGNEGPNKECFEGENSGFGEFFVQFRVIIGHFGSDVTIVD